MLPCLTLCIIKYGSRVWSNQGKRIVPCPTPGLKREASGCPWQWLTNLTYIITHTHTHTHTYTHTHTHTHTLMSIYRGAHSLTNMCLRHIYMAKYVYEWICNLFKFVISMVKFCIKETNIFGLYLYIHVYRLLKFFSMKFSHFGSQINKNTALECWVFFCYIKSKLTEMSSDAWRYNYFATSENDSLFVLIWFLLQKYVLCFHHLQPFCFIGFSWIS